MDDLPESLRMRPRRQAMFSSAAREVSEDGDFVTLKQVRKVLKQNNKRLRHFLLVNRKTSLTLEIKQ